MSASYFWGPVCQDRGQPSHYRKTDSIVHRVYCGRWVLMLCILLGLAIGHFVFEAHAELSAKPPQGGQSAGQHMASEEPCCGMGE